MSRIATHLAVAVAALAAGGAGAAALTSPEPRSEVAAAVPTRPVPPEQVRTVVVTRTIHRVRHVRVHTHRSAALMAPPPAPVAVAPRPVAVAARPVAAVPIVNRAPKRPLQARTSGHSGTGGGHDGEHEGGGDD